MDKKELRNEYIKLRNKIINKDEKSTIIQNIIINSDFYKSSNVIALYSNLEDEVDTSLLINKSLKLGKTVILPKVISDDCMKFFQIRDTSNLVNGKFNIKEPPKGSVLINSSIIDLMIIPGVCFDKFGNRIGFGKGYYDKYLNGKCNILRVGICFDEQLLKKSTIPSDIYDQKLGIIVTDKQVLRLNKNIVK